MSGNIKPFLSYDEQIQLLKNRNLIINDIEKAKTVLSTVNYYRLINAYSLGLLEKKESGEQHYKDGVSFYQIYDIYTFDNELRHIISEPLETFEVMFRTKLAHYIGEKYGATGYLNASNFVDATYHNEFMQTLEQEKENQKNSPIVKHHQNKYDGEMPIWVAVEVLSFGTISKLYSNLSTVDRNYIAGSMPGKAPEIYLNSWIRSFVEVRNICAHYGRLYNKKLVFPPKMFKGSLAFGNDNVFSVLYFLKRFEDPQKWSEIFKRLIAAVDNHPYVELDKIGFPSNWKNILKPV